MGGGGGKVTLMRGCSLYLVELEGGLQVGSRFPGSGNVCGQELVGVASTWYCSTYRPEQKAFFGLGRVLLLTQGLVCRTGNRGIVYLNPK